MKARPFVVLDRDGTILVERNYLSDPDQVELIPRVGEALARLAGKGFGLVVLTNQSGLARGYFDEPALERIHERMSELLAEHGVKLDGVYYCPHLPEDHCLCRKPRTGLLQLAARELGFELDQTFVIGDQPSDIDLGRRVGAMTFLVRTGYGAQVEQEGTAEPDFVVDDLVQAAEIIESMAGIGSSPA